MQAEARHLTGLGDRQRARVIRNEQWSIMTRLAGGGSVRIFWFGASVSQDPFGTLANNLMPEDADQIHGIELIAWIKRHKAWWEITRRASEPSSVRLRLTYAGRHALRNRGRYDMEPVEGGSIDDRWRCIPASGISLVFSVEPIALDVA